VTRGNERPPDPALVLADIVRDVLREYVRRHGLVEALTFLADLVSEPGAPVPTAADIAQLVRRVEALEASSARASEVTS
jgi:hypothetical protein